MKDQIINFDELCYSWVHQFKDRTIKTITLGVGFPASLPQCVDTIMVRIVYLHVSVDTIMVRLAYLPASEDTYPGTLFILLYRDLQTNFLLFTS